MRRILIDTNILIWWFNADKRLTPDIIKAIQDSEVFVSIVSCWEVIIKTQVKKLKMEMTLKEGLEDGAFNVLNLDLQHFNSLEKLEMLHRDPFDRIIIAQAISEKLTIITSDKIFEKYPVNIIQA